MSLIPPRRVVGCDRACRWRNDTVAKSRGAFAQRTGSDFRIRTIRQGRRGRLLRYRGEFNRITFPFSRVVFFRRISSASTDSSHPRDVISCRIHLETHENERWSNFNERRGQIVHPKSCENVGTLWRSAYQLGASVLYTIG